MFLDSENVDIRRDCPRKDLPTDLDWCRLNSSVLEKLSGLKSRHVQVELEKWLLKQAFSFVVQKQEYFFGFFKLIFL